MGDLPIFLLGGLIVVLSLFVTFAASPITSAFALVGLMVALAGIYGLIGAHMVAALQILVYAGAVMVLFVFSIMLLNMEEEKSEVGLKTPSTWARAVVAGVVFAVICYALCTFEASTVRPAVGPYSLEYIKSIGGNTQSLSALLFTKYFLQFEVMSFVILVAIVSALVLAKRKVD